jgi:hypothetical protein
MLAAAVVALAWVAFGVFVGELCALRPHHGRRSVVFAGNQLNVLFLALVFGLNGSKQLGVGLGNEDFTLVHGSSLDEGG